MTFRRQLAGSVANSAAFAHQSASVFDGSVRSAAHQRHFRGEAAPRQMSPQEQNAMARRLILNGGFVPNVGYFPPAVEMIQPLNPPLVSSPAPGSVLTFQPRNVGLIKRWIVRFTATVTAGAQDITLTKLGLANLVSSVIFTDLGNNQRINTTGWHLTAVASAKRRRVFAAAVTTDTPLGYGNINNRVMFAPATLATTVASEIDFELEIPCCKNDWDLRGVVFGDVTNANMQIQITLNPNMFVASTADATLAVYQSAGASLPVLSGLTWQVYQNYLDQLPKIGGNPILPALDLGTAYLLNNTASGLPVANQDNAAAFTNARAYESVTFVYDNNGTLNVNGSDLNYIQLQSANFTNIYNLDGRMISLMERNILADDFPAGMHYLDFRHRPIDTNQYGNMTLIIQPRTVGGSGAVILYGFEAYGIIGLVNQGGSLPMGA